VSRELITEEMGIQKEWYAELEKMDMENLPVFIDKLVNQYEHDYGTICHAIVAGAVATAKAIDRSDQGGITGFQAGCIMWGFLEHFNHIKAPARLLKFEDMLYPQNEDKFTVISEENWLWLRNRASCLLFENKEDQVSPRVWSHWEQIRDEVIPFGYKVKRDE